MIEVFGAWPFPPSRNVSSLLFLNQLIPYGIDPEFLTRPSSNTQSRWFETFFIFLLVYYYVRRILPIFVSLLRMYYFYKNVDYPCSFYLLRLFTLPSFYSVQSVLLCHIITLTPAIIRRSGVELPVSRTVKVFFAAPFNPLAWCCCFFFFLYNWLVEHVDEIAQYFFKEQFLREALHSQEGR